MTSARNVQREERRKLALARARELRNRISDYLAVEKSIPTGYRLRERINGQKEKILSLLGGSPQDWQDWRWQLRNRITDVDILAKIVELTPEEIEDIRRTGEKFRWAISPYYASLMDPQDPRCPIRLQAIPSIRELMDQGGSMDPMAETLTSPALGITRRYPDRLIINVTNQCAMYCRHCQRRRNIGETDRNTPRKSLHEALDYIRANPEIRDVLLTGGDAFLLDNKTLDWLLSELKAIPHLEIIRLGTRTPVTMPQRVTDKLCGILERHHPVYVNTQFNNPVEVTEEAAAACARLAKAGVPLGNQAVLLAGINDDCHIMKKLNHELLKIRVRPYYIFHAKPVKGTSHFGTKIETGLEIMENLRGQTSGLAIPNYIINAPQGYGKTPILPDYLLWLNEEKAVLRTWEKRVFEYPNNKN
jgi:glutamate 2,3-aminomutase